MTVASSVQPFTLTMPAGSLQEWDFTFTYLNAAGQQVPYPIPNGTTWEYVVRDTAAATGAPLLSLTTTASADGQLTVTSSAILSQIQLAINPAATASLTPQLYAHALWMDPGTAYAFAWFTGSLIVAGNPQP